MCVCPYVCLRVCVCVCVCVCGTRQNTTQEWSQKATVRGVREAPQISPVKKQALKNQACQHTHTHTSQQKAKENSALYTLTGQNKISFSCNLSLWTLCWWSSKLRWNWNRNNIRFLQSNELTPSDWKLWYQWNIMTSCFSTYPLRLRSSWHSDGWFLGRWKIYQNFEQIECFRRVCVCVCPCVLHCVCTGMYVFGVLYVCLCVSVCICVYLTLVYLCVKVVSLTGRVSHIVKSCLSQVVSHKSCLLQVVSLTFSHVVSLTRRVSYKLCLSQVVSLTVRLLTG